MQWTDIADRFYDNLDRALTERGARRTPLSEAVSGNAGYLKNAFKTKSEIKLGRFLALADALNIHPMVLLDGIVDPVGTPASGAISRSAAIKGLINDLAADAAARGEEVDAPTLTAEALAILHTAEAAKDKK